MSESIGLTIDGIKVTSRPGVTIMEAADGAGLYIPRLCWMKHSFKNGVCDVCAVKVEGSFKKACRQQVSDQMKVESETEEVHARRRQVLDELFAEGNHECPLCRMSGGCELKAIAYKYCVSAPH